MKDLLALAKTRDEYLLITTLVGVWDSPHIVKRCLDEYRRLPHTVDSYEDLEPCPNTGQTPSSPQ